MTKFWSEFTKEEIEMLAQKVFSEYRKSGFPFYPMLSDDERIKIYENLSSRSWEYLIQNKCIKQTMHGLGAIWSYFPHSWRVKCKNMLTPMDVFESDELFMKSIYKRLKHGTYLTDSGMRKALKTSTGVQTVSNFRPTAASAIYDHFNGGDVYDMSAGYGGRLFGAIISKKVKSYIGIDPCDNTYNGLLKLVKDFNYPSKNIEIIKTGSEVYCPKENSLDICFTSPPYFDTEKYDVDPTQSYIKYPTYSEWLNGFIKQTLINCYKGLKINGYLIYNISKTQKYPTLEKDFLDLANDCGFYLKDIYWLELSSIWSSGYKKEPVYIFTKNLEDIKL